MRNSEIAATMVLSERTVEHHVSAVLSKLGVETRAQAAHVATRDGIVAEGDEPSRAPDTLARWRDGTCDHCGSTGEVPAGEDPDTLLCTVCGEPVLADQSAT